MLQDRPHTGGFLQSVRNSQGWGRWLQKHSSVFCAIVMTMNQKKLTFIRVKNKDVSIKIICSMTFQAAQTNTGSTTIEQMEDFVS